jgi:hypothetical protein
MNNNVFLIDFGNELIKYEKQNKIFSFTEAELFDAYSDFLENDIWDNENEE